MPDLPPAATPLDLVELRIVELDLVRPLHSAHGIERRRSVVLVRVADAEGTEGWGECSALARPTYTHEDTASAWRILHDELAPAALAAVAPSVRTHPMATAALAGARLDLELRHSGRTLVEALGGTRRPLPVAAVVGRTSSIDELLDVVAAHLADGAALVKLKVGPGWDVGPLRAVRQRWPEVDLAADANGRFDDDPAVVAAIDELGLAYLEQPRPADDLLGSAALAASVDVPVALDESVTGPGLAAAALALGAGSALNVKPARVGGLAEALAVIEAARDADAGWFVGGMLETGIGRAVAAALASVPGARFPTDVGPSARYVGDDVTEPVATDDDGRLVVPDGPGIGVVPRAERLAACTVRRAVLRR